MDVKKRKATVPWMMMIFLVLSANFPLCSSAASQQPDNKMSNGFRSSFLFPVTGNVYPLGYYSISLTIGNPPKVFEFDIDTGSDLTWVQCDAPCTGCTKTNDHLYKPQKHILVSCEHPSCGVVHFPDSPRCEKPDDQCDFEVDYVDHGSVFGVVVSDFFSLRFMNGSLIHLQLTFGKNYLSSPAEVLFDGKPTGIRNLKVVFDSGSSYTYFSSQVYKAVLDLVRKGLTGKPLNTVEDKALPICWKGTKPFKSVHDVKKYFSTLTLIFPDTPKIQLELQPEAYLIVTEDGNACCGILNGTEIGLGDFNIIGDISLIDKMVVYDNEQQRIGWTSANCDRLP